MTHAIMTGEVVTSVVVNELSWLWSPVLWPDCGLSHVAIFILCLHPSPPSILLRPQLQDLLDRRKADVVEMFDALRQRAAEDKVKVSENVKGK